MAKIEQRNVLDPPSSRQVVEKIRAAIDDGSRRITLTIEGEPSPITCRISQSRFKSLSIQYLATIEDGGGSLTIKVVNHPDLSDSPALATIVRRD